MEHIRLDEEQWWRMARDLVLLLGTLIDPDRAAWLADQLESESELTVAERERILRESYARAQETRGVASDSFRKGLAALHESRGVSGGGGGDDGIDPDEDGLDDIGEGAEDMNDA